MEIVAPVGALLVLLIIFAVILIISRVQIRKLKAENKYLKENIALDRMDQNPYYGAIDP